MESKKWGLLTVGNKWRSCALLGFWHAGLELIWTFSLHYTVDWRNLLLMEDPLKEGWQPTPAFLLGKSHGQRSLVGYSPQSCKGPDMSEVTEHVCMRALLMRNCILYSKTNSGWAFGMQFVSMLEINCIWFQEINIATT